MIIPIISVSHSSCLAQSLPSAPLPHWNAETKQDDCRCRKSQIKQEWHQGLYYVQQLKNKAVVRNERFGWGFFSASTETLLQFSNRSGWEILLCCPSSLSRARGLWWQVWVGRGCQPCGVARASSPWAPAEGSRPVQLQLPAPAEFRNELPLLPRTSLGAAGREPRAPDRG